jgi:hypothetical protein
VQAYNIHPLIDVCLKVQNHLNRFSSVRKQVNDQYRAIFGLPNDCIGNIIEYVGDKQFRFIAGVSYRFKQVYLDTFEGDYWTNINCSYTSVSCAELYLDSVDHVPSSWVKEFNLLKYGQ